MAASAASARDACQPCADPVESDGGEPGAERELGASGESVAAPSALSIVPTE